MSRHPYFMTQSSYIQSSSLPCYKHICEQLKQMIRESYTSGDKLPTEKVLAGMFSVNRHTVRHAVDLLVQEGLVGRKHGVGIFLLEHVVPYPLESGTRFSGNLELAGIKSKVTKLALCREPSSRGIAEKLNLLPNDEICRLDVLRKANEKPIAISTHYFHLKLFDIISTKYLHGSLHSFLEKQIGFRPVRIESLVSAILPRGRDAQTLLMPRSHPILRVKSLNVHPKSEKPLEYVITRFRADLVELNIQL